MNFIYNKLSDNDIKDFLILFLQGKNSSTNQFNNLNLEEDKLNSYIKDPNFYIWLKNKPANVKEMFDKCQNNKDYSCLDFIYLQFKDAN